MEMHNGDAVACEDRMSAIGQRLAEMDRERVGLLDELRSLRYAALREGRMDGLDKREYPGTPREKVALFEKMFVARRDVYPQLWVNERTGKKGYSPVCTAVWEDGRRLKPTELFARYGAAKFERLSAEVIERHLRGRHVVGTYALRHDDRCVFLAADFDGDGWREDVSVYREAAAELGISCMVEISRSGNGAHAWIFFSEPVPARIARTLGSFILVRATARNPRLRLDTYDRFFPNQDTLPKGGFGNLIALPLQKDRRELGFTEFVDENFVPFPDQWKILAEVPRLSPEDVRRILGANLEADLSGEMESLDLEEAILESSQEESLRLPALPDWKVFLNEAIHIPADGLSDAMVARLKQTATIPNPVFFEKQRQRFPTYNIPRYIFSGEVHADRIVLPRGCLEEVVELFAGCGSRIEIEDRRLKPRSIRIRFTGKLTDKQSSAVRMLREYEHGVLVAPPGSGKTVIACALIGARKMPTLILVNRKTLLEQWLARIGEFLSMETKDVGQWQGAKRKLSGRIDVGMVQSVANLEDPKRFFREYGMVVVDESHHVPAVTVEALLKECGSRFIVALTATPRRKDRLERLLYQQCGPVRYVIDESSGAELRKRVFIRHTGFSVPDRPDGVAPLHVIWESLVASPERNRLIAGDVVEAMKKGKRSLVLSDRKEHLENLISAVAEMAPDFKGDLISLEGSLSGRQRTERLERFRSAVECRNATCLFATASLIGEGFDLPVLDTLFLAMPISFRGRLIQYTGRLDRASERKNSVSVYDYLDEDLALTCSMFRKRLPAYRQMGYEICRDRGSTGSGELLESR